MKSLLLYIMIFTLLCGCTVGPRYHAPAINAPLHFVSANVVKTVNQNQSKQTNIDYWWEGFNDPLLNRLVKKGIAHNYEVAAASARIEAAVARLNLAGSTNKLTADVNLNGNIVHNYDLNADHDSTTTRRIVGSLLLGLPLDFFGRTRRAAEAAHAGLMSAQAELNQVKLDVSSNITREYMQLRGNQRQIELLHKSVTLQEKTLSVVNSRYRAGIAPELDLRRAETTVENLRASIPPLTAELIRSRNRLAGLTGEFPGVYEEMFNSNRTLSSYDALIPELVPLQVLSQRPDILQAEAGLKQAIARIGVAKAEYYPAFQLSNQISIGATGMSSMPTINTLIKSLGAVIEQTLLDGGARRANVKLATANAKEALANYELALRAASESVEASLAALGASLSRQQALSKALNSSERSFAQAEALYQQGLISFLDVVDAQRVLATAEQTLAREQTNYATEIATLFNVMGVSINASGDIL